jgi:hypothetical protein
MRKGGVIRKVHSKSLRRWVRLVSALVGLTSLACLSARAQRSAPAPPPVDLPANSSAATAPVADDALPDAPTPNIAITPPDDDDSAASSAPQQNEKQTSPGFPPVSPSPWRHLPTSPGEHPGIPSLPLSCQAALCAPRATSICCARKVDYFQRFVDTGIHPLTPRQKAELALRNTTDLYNFATIAFISALSVATDPNSAYGPGVPGFGRNFGVAYCETAVGEFFGTFLIPSIAHQDPHYHRMPNASYPRRALHAITQVGWAQSDYGTGMPNYSNLVGTATSIGIGNLYVPGRDTSFGSSAARYTTAIATSPIDNFITEFLPDVARRVNIRIVLIQQIVNQVEKQQ